MTALPDRQHVRDWCQVSVESCPDPMLDEVMAGEAANQEKACLIDDPADRDPDLIQAFYRRCARELAARDVPLGILAGEAGPARLSGFDGEIDRLEGYDRGFYFG